MSRLYFHSPSGTAELLGAGRAHAGIVVQRIGCGAVDAFHHHERLQELINPEHDMARLDTSGEKITWAFWFDRYLSDDDRSWPLLAYRGHRIDGLSLLLNTAIAVGSDPVRLLARIDGQCELHCYVEGPNRAWLAGVIDEGLDSGVIRRVQRYQPPPGAAPDPAPEDWPVRDIGWDGVAALLRARDDEPVVLSDSRTTGFPAPHGELPEEGRWDASMAELRARSETARLELAPGDWARYRFDHCLTVFDLYADDYAARIEEALGTGPAESGVTR
ncbi:hypothetical protein [Actinomadura nitritigenes]|uniref:hypothetical protein n=1 Tax=Actinomadura nitritigenes TaxID=134602 RepID=UPI003D8FF0E1